MEVLSLLLGWLRWGFRRSIPAGGFQGKCVNTKQLKWLGKFSGSVWHISVWFEVCTWGAPGMCLSDAIRVVVAWHSWGMKFGVIVD